MIQISGNAKFSIKKFIKKLPSTVEEIFLISLFDINQTCNVVLEKTLKMKIVHNIFFLNFL